MDAEVDWDDYTQTVTATRGDTVVIMQIGNSVITVAGNNVTLDVSPMIVNNRTLVPARAVAESFGVAVDWDDATQTVTLSTGATVINHILVGTWDCDLPTVPSWTLRADGTGMHVRNGAPQEFSWSLVYPHYVRFEFYELRFPVGYFRYIVEPYRNRIRFLLDDTRAEFWQFTSFSLIGDLSDIYDPMIFLDAALIGRWIGLFGSRSPEMVSLVEWMYSDGLANHQYQEFIFNNDRTARSVDLWGVAANYTWRIIVDDAGSRLISMQPTGAVGYRVWYYRVEGNVLELTSATDPNFVWTLIRR